MPADPMIYDRLWSADRERFSVSVRNQAGEWIDPKADILLDHQVEAAGPRNIDLATQPLFSRVNTKKFEGSVYQAYEALLNNYLVNYRDPEDYTEQEKQEDMQFLSLVMQTGPMNIAYEYVTRDLRKEISRDAFQDRLWTIWFEPYTNHFRGQSTDHCSGFEHVFVGEGKYNRQMGVARGEVAGYHDWIKFYLDESQGRVDFRGTKYDVQGQPEPRNPNVVTLQMVWNLMDTRGNVVAELFKKRGGFFVGPSPSCSLAMGTVAFYESAQNLAVDERRRVRIQGDEYNLVIYRETKPDGSRGDHIRSFFPEYLGGGLRSPQPNPGDVIVRPPGDFVRNDGAVVIAEILPNPAGDDATGETVTLKNNTPAAINLVGWQMADKLDRVQELSGRLTAGEAKTFPVDRGRAGGMQLGNSGGRIQIIDPRGEFVASVVYGPAAEGQVVRF